MDRLEVDVQSSEMELLEAQRLAEERARGRLEEPMTLSWLDRRTGRHFPAVDCCGDERRPAWQIYAESRGGVLRVDVGDRFTFILREGTVEPRS